AVLSDADLRGAVLSGANLSGAVLSDADLRGAVLSGANLRGADLSDAGLRGAVLRDADLRGADLSGANLRDAVLRGANLRDAVLRGANLRDAVLRGAVLRGANLRDAVLRDADLRDADLRGADGKPLPRATPEQAIESLDKVRAIILDDQERLNMDHWHDGDDWRDRTCAEEAVCGTTHCLAGWLQVCSTEPALRTVEASLAGALAAPIAAKMFYRGQQEALTWLETRAYVKESAEAERRAAARAAAQGGAA
ncbi:MAG: pentapeptide repeat-containing protein, partial [Ramlibacter sp.]|nr:pentapeptide repeat-containing protein [Ramlibacter sp.]